MLTKLLKDNDLQAYYNRKCLENTKKPKFRLLFLPKSFNQNRILDKVASSVLTSICFTFISLFLVGVVTNGQFNNFLIVETIGLLLINLFFSVFTEAGLINFNVKSYKEFKLDKQKYEENIKSLDYSNIKSLGILKEFIDQDIITLKNSLYVNLKAEQTKLRESGHQLGFQIMDIKDAELRTNLQAIQSKLEAKLKSVNNNLDSLVSFETSLKNRFKFIPHLIELIKANELISEIDQSDDLTELIQSMINTSSNDNSYKELLEVYL